jgi:hypothetical protein
MIEGRVLYRKTFLSNFVLSFRYSIRGLGKGRALTTLERNFARAAVFRAGGVLRNHF